MPWFVPSPILGISPDFGAGRGKCRIDSHWQDIWRSWNQSWPVPRKECLERRNASLAHRHRRIPSSTRRRRRLHAPGCPRSCRDWRSGHGLGAGSYRPTPGGVRCHYSSSTWVLRPRGVRELSAAMRLQTKPFRLLVQYVPQMFGCRGMNLPFCFWLSSLRRCRPWVMFHEVACPWEKAYLTKQNLLAAMQRIMAWLVLRHSLRVFVSIPKWEPMLPGTRRVEWLPIPSNLPVTVASTKREAIRATLVPPGSIVLGHFGTYGGAVAPLLSEVLPALLVGHENRHVLLLGRNSAALRPGVSMQPPRTGAPHPQCW